MKPTSFTPWSRAALAAGPLALLLLSPPVGAREHVREGDAQRLQREQGQVSQTLNGTGPTGSSSGLGVPAMRRQVKPDPARQKQLIGEVVEMEGRTLTVQGENGTQVPFDVSALQFSKQPEEGQEVRVTYQVDEDDNVATGIEGAVTPPAPEEE